MDAPENLKSEITNLKSSPDGISRQLRGWANSLQKSDITDPIVGGPLKSSMDAAGLVIYGVGMNKADDGGEVIPTEDRHHAKDAGLVHGW